MSTREEKRRKRAILLHMLNEDDSWQYDQKKINQVQSYTSKEILHLESPPQYVDNHKKMNRINEEAFLNYIYLVYDYESI